MDQELDFIDNKQAPSREGQSSIQLNPKRVAARIFRYWYIVLLSLLTALGIAYAVNRYSERIYPVRASIIIKENYENVGAKFLYNNELINPYRNFYNELYIMKSFPLLQEVMLDLDFDVSLFREGEIKTSEYYDPLFPVTFNRIGNTGYGISFNFQVTSATKFSIQYPGDIDGVEGKIFGDLSFGDTIRLNGARLVVNRVGNIDAVRGKSFIVRFNNPLSLAQAYSSKLSATWAQQGAAVVNLEVLGTVPQKEIDFLNKFIERYQAYDVEKKNKVATMAIQFLDEQLLHIGDSLKFFEDQVENFKRRNIITDLGQETTRLYQKLQDFEDQKFQYRLNDNYYNYVTKLLQNNQFEGIFTPASVGITDNVIAGLVNQLIDLQTQVNLYKSYSTRGVDKGTDNPRLTEKLQQIQLVKNDIIKTIENSKRTQGINVAFVDDQIRLVEKELAGLPGTERELVAIQRNYSLKENLYVFLLQKRTEAGLSKASTTSDIIIVNPPLAAAAISPEVSKNYGVAAGAGLMLPLLVFILIELLNSRIQSKEDIEKFTSVPVIGGVGHNISGDPVVVFNRPRSAIAESFRAIRSSLNYFTGNQEHQIFMVTSSVPGEGKSFTTINLATVFALAGKKTVIVGADLRKPKLFDDLGLENNVGLSQYLSKMAPLEKVMQKTSIPGLYLIAGGPMPPNPSELLLKPEMSELLERLKADFDFVVIDTPPLSLVTDAFVVSRFADHSIFVIRQNFTPRLALADLEEQYSSGKLPKVSILFNDLRKSGMGYGYGRGYAYGYGYGYGYGYRGSRKRTDSSGYYVD